MKGLYVRAATWYLEMFMPGFFCINVEHSLLYIFFKGPNMPRSSGCVVWLLCGGRTNATGNHIPPYYIFPGQRWNDAFLNDAAPGSDGEMSVTGWSNTAIFQNYITKHFANHAGITDQQPTLILHDGHQLL
jgi:hypothetical protein